uniref:Uncharacterized protein n=1 Tax=Arundo donax TaxID=35708 RepID=A0A0A9D0L2_ARUDO
MMWQRLSTFLQPCLVQDDANRPSCYFICCGARGVSEKSDYVYVICSSHWTSESG